MATLLPLALLAAHTLGSPTGEQRCRRPATEEIQTFAEVFERIKRGYVEEVDDRTLLRNAMRGMLNELTPTRPTWMKRSTKPVRIHARRVWRHRH